MHLSQSEAVSVGKALAAAGLKADVSRHDVELDGEVVTRWSVSAYISDEKTGNTAYYSRISTLDGFDAVKISKELKATLKSRNQETRKFLRAERGNK